MAPIINSLSPVWSSVKFLANGTKYLIKGTLNTAVSTMKIGGLFVSHRLLTDAFRDTQLNKSLTGLCKWIRPWVSPCTQAVFVPAADCVQKIIDFTLPPIKFISNNYADGSCKLLTPILYKCNLWDTIGAQEIAEELIFRAGIQKSLLPAVAKVLPRPFDSLLNAKITRIVLTTLLFAASHPFNDLASQLVAGVIFGFVAENSFGVPKAALLHLLCNGFLYYLRAVTPYHPAFDPVVQKIDPDYSDV